MSRPELPPKQKRIYEALKSFITTNGYSPTRLKLAELAGLSVGSIQKQLLVLEVKGYITRADNGARSIILVKLDDETSNPT